MESVSVVCIVSINTNVILLFLFFFFFPSENNVHVHDLLTFQQITVVSKAKGATLFACDLQVCKEKYKYSQIKKIYSLIYLLEYNKFLLPCELDAFFFYIPLILV